MVLVGIGLCDLVAPTAKILAANIDKQVKNELWHKCLTRGWTLHTTHELHKCKKGCHLRH